MRRKLGGRVSALGKLADRPLLALTDLVDGEPGELRRLLRPRRGEVRPVRVVVVAGGEESQGRRRIQGGGGRGGGNSPLCCGRARVGRR